MQRRDTARTALSLAVGLLMLLLGVILPAPSGSETTAGDAPAGHIELLAHSALDQAATRSGRPVQPASGGLFAVLPAVPVSAVLTRHLEPTGFGGELRAAERSAQPVRAWCRLCHDSPRDRIASGQT